MMQFTPLTLGKLNALYAHHQGHHGPRKVMVVLHGLGDVKESYKDFARELNLTGLDFLLVDAIHPYPIGKAWYWPERPLLKDQMIDQSIRELEEGLHQLKSHFLTLYPGHPYSDDSICLLGFSAGAVLALELGLKLNKEGKSPFAIIALSPRLFQHRLESYREQIESSNLIIHHGTHDLVIPYNETKSVAQKLGIESKLISYPIDHTIVHDQIISLRDWLNNLL